MINAFTQQIGNMLDNRLYVLDGVEGIIKYLEYPVIYPYAHIRQYIWHNPTEKGKQTPQYKQLSRILNDSEHFTDLTHSDQLCDIVLSFDPNFEIKE